MDILVPIICCVLCWVFGIYVGKATNTVCLNSAVYYPTICGIKPIKFYVIKVEEAFDTNHNLIAKYTVEVRFFSKKNDRGYKIYTFKFYNSPGKYSIGDTLTLITYNE